MNDIMVRKTTSWITIYLALRKSLFNYWILVFACILFTMHFLMIKCTYDVIYLFTFIIYECDLLQLHMGSKY